MPCLVNRLYIRAQMPSTILCKLIVSYYLIYHFLNYFSQLVTLDQSSLSDSVPDLQQHSDQRFRDEQIWRKRTPVPYQQRLSRKYFYSH